MAQIKRLIILSITILLAVGVFAGEKRQSVGLVLSGGGAKGIAHIGVIKAFEENEIPIDYVAGTSMGAIISGLYAVGYSPDEMLQLVSSKEFLQWSSGQINEKLTYYFAKEHPTPAMLNITIARKDSVKSNSILPSSIISPLPMNFAFMELFSAYTAQCGGDFNKLFVPFRCVTSDVYNKHKIVCSSGDLGDAVRASMSFPIVFQPITMDSIWVYDGGIYDNFPVDVMREDFAPSIIIGVDVAVPSNKQKSNDILDQIETMIIQDTIQALYKEEGIKIDVPLHEYNMFDFSVAKEIYDIGYQTAMSMMDSIKSRVTSRTPDKALELRRRVFKSKTPYLVFDSVSVSGGTMAQNDYIKYLFSRNGTDTFGIARAKEAYYKAITPGKLKNLMPKAVYDDTTGIFKLDLVATVKDNLSVGFGGYITSSTNSMVFLSAGYKAMQFKALSADVNAWIGQSYMAGSLNAGIYLPSSLPSSLNLQAVISRQRFYENEKLFYQDNNLPTFITSIESFVRLKYCIASGRNGITDIGAGYGYLDDKFYPNSIIDYSALKRDKETYGLGQIYARYEYNTLDDDVYPVMGAYYNLTAMGVLGRYDYFHESSQMGREHSHVGWGQAEFVAKNFFGLSSHFVLGTVVNIFASTKKLLDNYNATIVSAPAFYPTASSYNAFNSAYRANSYATVGILPIWKILDNLQLRGTFHAFLPFRKIKENPNDNSPYYGKWFADPDFFGEIACVYNFHFASLSLYGNYLSEPAHNWNFGISFGLFILAPKFLR